MRIVCGPECNHGWMEALENEAEPYLRTMIVGNGREFHKTGRSLIAEWTYKTALVFGTALKDKPPPLSYYSDFYRDRELPPGAMVWFGASASARMYYRQMRLVVYDFDDLTQGEGWMATLSVGHMVVHIVWLERGERATLQVRGQLAQALRQVWPLEGRASWPPPVLLDEPRMDRICNSYGGAF
jgi:hypothetical protein